MTLSTQNRRKAIVAIIAAATVMTLSFSLSVPLVSLAMERRGIGSDMIGLMGALPALAFLIASPAIPKLTRILGVGNMLWGSLALCCLSILGLALTETLFVWFILRLSIGLAMAVLFLISETWLNQVAEDKNRGRTVAIYITSLTCGLAAGPLIINVIGTQGTTAYYLASLIISTAGFFFYYARGTYPDLSGHSQFSIFSFIKIAPIICAAVLLVAFFDGAVLTLLAVYGVKNGMTAETSVLMTSVLLAGNILLQFPIGWFSDRVGRQPAILLCGVIGLLGALLLPVLIDIPFLLWPMLLIWGGAVVGIYTLALVIMGHSFIGADLVTANAAAGFVWGLGTLIGPSSAGMAMQLYEPHGMPLSFAFVCLVFLIITVRHRRKVRA